MTLGFDVSANPQAAVGAVKAITRGFEELRQKVREVNGELNRLSPEVREEANEVNRRLSAIINSRMGRPFKEGLRLSGQGDLMPLMIDPQRVYPSSQSAGSRTMQQMARVANIPIMTPVPAMPGAGAGAGAAEAEGAAAGGAGAGAMGAFRFASRYVLPLAGLTAGVGTLFKAVSDAQEQAVRVDALFRTLGDVRGSFESVQAQVEKFGSGLGIAQQESVRLMQAFAGIANITDAARLRGEGRQAAGFARAFGLSPEQAIGPFASMRFLGQGGSGVQGARELALMISEAVARSGFWAKSDEVLAAMARFTQSASGYLVEAAPTRQFADLYAQLSATGKPGLMGQNGENIIARMDAAFRQGGGSEASKVFFWRALRETDPFKFRYDLSQGLLQPDQGGRTNLDKVMEYFNTSFKGAPRFMRASMFSDIFPGINPVQADALLGLKLDQHQMGGFGKFLSGAGVDLEKMQPDSYQLLAQIYQGKGLESIRQTLLKQPGLTDAQTQALRGVTDDNAQSVLAQVAASTGRVKTEGSEQLDATQQMRDALLDLGKHLVPDVQSIKEILAGSLGYIARGVGYVTDSKPQAGGLLGSAIRGIYGMARSGLPVGAGGEAPMSAPLHDHTFNQLLDAVHNPSWANRLLNARPLEPTDYVTRPGAQDPQPQGQPGITVQ